jgi:NAD(P)-dependent dehydrogenase (short-subunit alcohol dehydrogenase family)
MSRTVVVTGASAGVGRAAAAAFGARGDRVALIARGREGLASAVRDVESAGGHALALPCDVSDAAAVDAAAQRAEDELGPIDVWVNDAMAAVLAYVHETDPADFRRVTEVTYLGCVHGTMAALARMRPRDRGVIVQVGSALAYRAIPLQASYCGAKFAIRGFTDALRAELMHERSNVRVTMVQLPGLNTPQFTWVRTTLRRQPQPVPPIYQPELAADAIVYAADHPRREVWLGGSTVITILGNKLAPWFADRYLARTNVQAQQTDQPLDPTRRDYLYEPLDDHADRGAHGPFDARAKRRSLQFGLSKLARRLVP